MISLLKLMFWGAVALALLIPAGILLALVGLPAMLVLGVLAIPVVVVLALIGLPIILTVVAAAVLFALIVGVLGMVVGLAVAAVKVALFIILPIAIVVWLVRRIRAGRAEAAFDWS